MKKALFILLGVLIILAIIVLGIRKEEQRSNKSTTGKEVVKIGITLPLTEGAPELAQEYLKSAKLRLSQIPANSKFEYKLFIEDDKMQTKTELLNAKKLIDINKVDVLWPGWSGATNTISPMADEKKSFIHFNQILGNEYANKSEYTFSHFTRPEEMYDLWLEEARKRGIKNISIVIIDNPISPFTLKIFEKHLAKYEGMSLVDVQYINPETKSFDVIIKKMESKNPDVYFALLIPPLLDIWGKDLKLSGNKVPVSATTSLGYSSDFSLFEGSWVSGYQSLGDKFINEYKKEYSVTPSFPIDNFAYDAIDLIVNTYEKYDKKPTIEQFENDLYELNNYASSILGELKINKETGEIMSNPELKIIKDGKMRKLYE